MRGKLFPWPEICIYTINNGYATVPLENGQGMGMVEAVLERLVPLSTGSHRGNTAATIVSEKESKQVQLFITGQGESKRTESAAILVTVGYAAPSPWQRYGGTRTGVSYPVLQQGGEGSIICKLGSDLWLQWIHLAHDHSSPRQSFSSLGPASCDVFPCQPSLTVQGWEHTIGFAPKALKHHLEFGLNVFWGLMCIYGAGLCIREMQRNTGQRHTIMVFRPFGLKSLRKHL